LDNKVFVTIDARCNHETLHFAFYRIHCKVFYVLFVHFPVTRYFKIVGAVCQIM